MSGVPDDMPDIPEKDTRGKYDQWFFRIGGGVCVIGIAVISFFFYQGTHSDDSLAEMAGLVHMRLEGVAIGAGLILVGLCIVVGGPILSRKIRNV